MGVIRLGARPWCVCAGVLLGAGVLLAQAQFVDARRSTLAEGLACAVRWADVDGDGQLDLLAFSTVDRVYRGLGDGQLVEDPGALVSAPGTAVSHDGAVADFDADGDLDVVVARSDGANVLRLNDGAGRFVDATAGRLPAQLEPCAAVAAADVDGDGDVDVLCANRGQNRLYLNDGGARFVDASAAQLPVSALDSAAVAAADLDGDGDVDAFWASDGEDRLYHNNGAGTFVDVTASFLPVASPVDSAAVVAFDAEGDGDIDLGIGVRGQNRLWRQEPGGRFVDATAALPLDADETAAIAAGDVDGDGDLDLLLGNGGTRFAQQNRLYCNDGTGSFGDATATLLPVAASATSAVALGDVDGDGDPDAAVDRTLWLNQGGGRMGPLASRPLPDVWFVAMAVGDVDGDRDVDIVGAWPALVLLQNDGRGGFTDLSSTHLLTPFAPPLTRDLALGDLDGDGDLDLLLGNQGGHLQPRPDWLLLNDGTGRFGGGGSLPPNLDTTTAVALADVDRDGDLDAVTTATKGFGFGPAVRLYLNDGAAAFVDGAALLPPPVLSASSLDVAAADLDGDGDMDLALANGHALGGGPMQNELFLNDGAGRFRDATATHLPVRVDYTFGVTAADVDHDGDVDLLWTNTASNALYLNDGTGRFVDASASLPPTPEPGRALAVGDVDEDGDLDLMWAGSSTVTLQLNEGGGTFRNAPGRLPNTDEGGLMLADVDGDADLDVVRPATRSTGRSTLWVNRHRHVSASWFPFLGRRYDLSLAAEPGYAAAATLVLPFVGGAPVPQPVAVAPHGRFGLDPFRTVVLSPVLLPRSVGELALPLRVPVSPSLAGQLLSAQGLVVHGAMLSAARLSNTHVDRVER
ncbi:MAG: VCBS repeat-containing protein [Planctomycetota bacterium]